MKFYRAYLESDGRNRRGASGSSPAEKREDQVVWFSPSSDWVVYDYKDGSGKECRQCFKPEKYGDGTWKVYFFSKDFEYKEESELFGQPKPKKKTKKKVVKDVNA